MANGAEASPYGRGPAYSTTGHGGPAAGRIGLKERPYIQGLLLSVVTLGLYGLWWHYTTHDELCRQVGRENKERPLWIAHVVLRLLVVVLFFVIIVMFFAAVFTAAEQGRFSEEEAAEAAIQALLGLGFGALLWTAAWVAQHVVFIVYVAKQYNLISEVRHSLGMPPKTGAGWFFGWYYGAGLTLLMFTAVLWFIGPMVAYVNPQEHYNELYRHYAYGRHPGASMRPAGQGLAAGSTPSSGAGAGTAYGDDTDPWASTQAAPAATPTGEEGWGRQSDRNTFRIKGQDDAEAPAARQIAQSFKCPRCHEHVAARGAPGTMVPIRCAACGEGGEVRLPEA